ncbi:MAG: thiolase family protein [Thermincola sp.]|jgi:acetyl-CoA acetyltransferase|nr:thiolase family protein [Thermincola sp.]MDT3702886.1 thiolase family protein [Thermincola sp.]
MYSKAFIPYGGYYSSPFVRWQGSIQNENSIELGAATAKRWLATKNMIPTMFDYLFVGKSVGQLHSFYTAPWAAALLGAEGTTGLHIPQACSTSTTCVGMAAAGLEVGNFNNAFCLMTDRMSNGPHTIWPNPNGPGGEVLSENWVMDSFGRDPHGKVAMIQTAENVVKKAGNITKEECDAVTFRRYEQYLDALANDREFQKRYMFAIEYKKSKKEVGLVEADEGVMPTTKEALAKLKPVIEGGVLSFGSQTHPADGNCGIIVTTEDKAKELSSDKNIQIQVLSYGFARTEKAHMAMAVVPSALMALEKAGLEVKDVKVIKTHNPFAANDVYMAKVMGIDVMRFNNYGCSLIYGHPQGPTGGRGIIELIEELVLLGGGYGLFTGCAAGDTGAALVIKVS